MIITKISVQEKNKEYCNVFLDDNYAFSLSLEQVILLRLKVGNEVSKKDVKDIILKSEIEKAKNLAIKYLSKYLKTKKEIKEYLTKKGFEYIVVREVIDKLIEYSLIDDLSYSKKFIEANSRTQGKRMIEYKLMMKGVSKDIIACAYSQVEVDETDGAINLAKKHLRNKELTRENLSKTYKYLVGKGFSYEQAESAINYFKEQ